MSLLKVCRSSCCAVGCSMRRNTNLLSQVRLFGFPKDPRRRQLWELAVRRANWNATPSSKLCNFHFVTGAPSEDETHPDYVPSIFPYCQQSTDVKQKLSGYERLAKRRRVKNESLISDNGHKSPRPRLRPFTVPSLHLPVTDNSEGSTQKHQATKKRQACNKDSNRSFTHFPTTSHKSTLRSKAVNKLEFEPTKVSIKDLRHSTIELWQKNETLKKNIKSLENEGYKEEDFEWYTTTLQEHQYIKDLAKRIMGRLADIENTTITKVHEEFGMI